MYRLQHDTTPTYYKLFSKRTSLDNLTQARTLDSSATRWISHRTGQRDSSQDHWHCTVTHPRRHDTTSTGFQQPMLPLSCRWPVLTAHNSVRNDDIELHSTDIRGNNNGDRYHSLTWVSTAFPSRKAEWVCDVGGLNATRWESCVVVKLKWFGKLWGWIREMGSICSRILVQEEGMT